MRILVRVFEEALAEGRLLAALSTARGLSDMGYTRGYYLASAALDELGWDFEADKAARRAASAGDPDGLRRWGLALRRRGSLKPAVRALSAAARISADAHWDALLVDWRSWAGDPQAGVAALGKAAEVEPFVRLTRAYRLLDLGLVDEAEGEFRAASSGGFTEAWIPLGNIAAGRNDVSAAIHWFAKGSAAGDPHAMFNEALMRWDSGDSSEALRLFREAAAEDRRARRWLSTRHRARKRARQLIR
jgi:tetratricopeptide (TPR) repeat protein